MPLFADTSEMKCFNSVTGDREIKDERRDLPIVITNSIIISSRTRAGRAGSRWRRHQPGTTRALGAGHGAFPVAGRQSAGFDSSRHQERPRVAHTQRTCYVLPTTHQRQHHQGIGRPQSQEGRQSTLQCIYTSN